VVLFAAAAGCVADGAYDGGVGYCVDFYDVGGYDSGGWGPATESVRRGAGATVGGRMATQHHMPPIDQHRRRELCRRCRRVREADRRAEQAGAITGGERLERIATADHAQQYHDDCDHQKDMDEAAEGVRRHHPQQP